MKKITVVGAGNVGATCAFVLALRDVADVALIDVAEGVAEGKALDMMQSSAILGFESKVEGSSDYGLMDNSDVVVVTAGLPRKPGMSRADLLAKNAQIMSSVCKEVKERAPKSILITVTNPLDVMTYLAYKETGFVANRVLGMAGILDTARFRYFLSDKTEVSANKIEAMIVGSHADDMVVLDSQTKVNGEPLEKYLSNNEKDQMKERTQKAGAQIVSLLKTGSAYFAPGSGAAILAEAVIKDSKAIIPTSCYLTGQYGFEDVYAGVPAVIGKDGVEEIVELDLDERELEEFKNSVAQIKAALKAEEMKKR